MRSIAGEVIFRFRYREALRSKQLLHMPVYFGAKRFVMSMDVVDAEIPLLISLKDAKTVINTAEDMVSIWGVITGSV